MAPPATCRILFFCGAPFFLFSFKKKKKGFRFSTYATWWVHQGIHCGFADCGRVIRLPMNLHTQVCKVVRLQAAMVDQLGREPTTEELCLESGLDKRTVRLCQCFVLFFALWMEMW